MSQGEAVVETALNEVVGKGPGRSAEVRIQHCVLKSQLAGAVDQHPA